jgi:hypothetical protein
MHAQRKHLRAVPVSPTRSEQEDSANRSRHKHPAPFLNFKYGEVVSQRVSAAHLLTNNFYSLDADTATAINVLAKTITLWDWLKKECDVRFRTKTIWVSPTPKGWLVSRAYKSEYQNLTHQHYLLPILFPTAEMAQAVVQLCLPTVHPALDWRRKRIEQAPAKLSGLNPAFGWIDWTRVLPEHAWLYLTMNPGSA